MSICHIEKAECGYYHEGECLKHPRRDCLIRLHKRVEWLERMMQGHCSFCSGWPSGGAYPPENKSPICHQCDGFSKWKMMQMPEE